MHISVHASDRRKPGTSPAVGVSATVGPRWPIVGVHGAADRSSAAGVDANDWLARRQHVPDAVRPGARSADNGAGRAEPANHSCWMLLNGIAHDEAPGTPGYTVDGDAGGQHQQRGRVERRLDDAPRATSICGCPDRSTPSGSCGRTYARRRTASAPARRTRPSTPWKSAATLDVIRGTSPVRSRRTPIVFPGNGATTSLTRFVAESPDPRIVLRLGRPQRRTAADRHDARRGVTSAGATLPVPTVRSATCVLTGANTTGVASSILGGDNAVVVVPDGPLVTGTYTVSVSSNGGAGQLVVQRRPERPLRPERGTAVERPVLGGGDGLRLRRHRSVSPTPGSATAIARLPAGQQVRVQIAGQQGLPDDLTAVSANFTIAEPSGDGYLTAFNCSGIAAPGVDAQLPSGRGDRQPGRRAARRAVRCASTRTPTRT